MMRRLCEYFGTDGLLHMGVCMIAVVLLSALLPLWVAALLTVVLGLTKEIVWDKWATRGTFDIKDLIADAVGIVLGCGLSMV